MPETGIFLFLFAQLFDFPAMLKTIQVVEQPAEAAFLPDRKKFPYHRIVYLLRT